MAIQQIWLPDFEDRVDRCTTCHLGVADTLMAGAPEPFGAPSGAPPHTPEAFDRFGCTSCHGGQGLATTQRDAHGDSPDAGPPMTPRRLHRGGLRPLPPVRDRPRGARSFARPRPDGPLRLLRLPRRPRTGELPFARPRRSTTLSIKTGGAG